jgi:hypothetical protein
MRRTLHLDIEVELQREPIAGVLTQDVSHRPFAGWLELAAAIDEARTAAAAAAGAPSKGQSPTEEPQ